MGRLGSEEVAVVRKAIGEGESERQNPIQVNGFISTMEFPAIHFPNHV
jgi:hypothetical protein